MRVLRRAEITRRRRMVKACPRPGGIHRHGRGAILAQDRPQKTPGPQKAQIYIRDRMKQRILTIVAVAVLVSSVACSSGNRSEEHTSELQSQSNLVCRLLLEKK